jgi:hypothetical protein
MGNDVTRLPPWGAPDGLAVQATNSRRVTWCAEDRGCRVKNGDLLNVFRSWAEGEGRGPSEGWMLLVEEEDSDEIVEVNLTDVVPKRLKRSTRIPCGCIEGISRDQRNT